MTKKTKQGKIRRIAPQRAPVAKAPSRKTSIVVNRSAPPGAVVPVLIYENVGRAADWLCDTFGFRERLRAGNGHAQLAIGKGAVMLGGSACGPGIRLTGRC